MMNRKRPGSTTVVPYVYRNRDDQERVAAEFGRLTVPERHAAPDDGTIELAFVRVPSHNPRPGRPIVYVSGGPGASGIDAGRSPELFAFLMRLRRIADVVVFDQRGTGLSSPRLDNPYRWSLPLDRPGDRDQVVQAARSLSRHCADFWRDRGVRLEAYNTEESVGDLGLLREGLRAERLSLVGKSYGTHLTMAAMRHRPDEFDRAVVVTVEGSDHTIKLPGNIELQLRRIDKRIADQPELREQVPDLLALIRSVLGRLAAQPVMVTATDPRTGQPASVVVGEFDLRWATATGLGQRDFIAELPARYLTMAAGDFAWLAERVIRRRTAWFGNTMGWCMDCASGMSSQRAERVRAEAPETLLGEVIDLPLPYVCGAWSDLDLGPQFREPFTSDAPVLFVSGTLDGRTPPSNVEDIQDGYPNSQHLVVDGATHSGADYWRPPVSDRLYHFLTGEPVSDLQAAVPFEFTVPSSR